VSEEIVQASFHRERFKFRFLDLTESAVERLRKMLPDVNLKVHFRGTGAVVTFLVTEDLNCEALYSFLKQEALSPRKHSVWVSVVSSSDHDGVSLPEYVLGIIRRTMCGVDFAFVGCLGDPIEDEVSQGI
jgi:hypothetical protein